MIKKLFLAGTIVFFSLVIFAGGTHFYNEKTKTIIVSKSSLSQNIFFVV
jgi:hypothetical protein